MSPLTATLYTSPTTALCVMPFAIGFEARKIWEDPDFKGAEARVVCAILTGIATLVFTLIMSEYWLVNATSSLALSVAGVFKELLTIVSGLFFLGEHIDRLNVIGFCTCQAGILAYVFIRYDNDRAAAYTPVTPQGEDRMMPTTSTRDNFNDEEVELATLTIT